MKLKKFNFKIINSTNDLAIKIIKNTNNQIWHCILQKNKKMEEDNMEKMDFI